MPLKGHPEIRVNKPQSAQRTAESTEILEKPLCSLWFKNNVNIVVIVIYKGVAHASGGAPRDKSKLYLKACLKHSAGLIYIGGKGY